MRRTGTFEIARSVGIAAIGADARGVGDGETDLGARQLLGGGGTGFDDAVLEEGNVFRIGSGNGAVGFVGERVTGLRAGVGVGGGDKNVPLGDSHLLGNACSGASDDFLGGIDDVVGDEHDPLAARFQIEGRTQQWVMDAGAVAPNVGVPKEECGFGGGNVGRGSPHKKRLSGTDSVQIGVVRH